MLGGELFKNAHMDSGVITTLRLSFARQTKGKRELGPVLEPSIDVAAVRAFTRFYTRKVGVVDGMASHPFSLAEARVLYEARSPRPANSYPHPQGAWA